jgi:hypothetical protein
MQRRRNRVARFTGPTRLLNAMRDVGIQLDENTARRIFENMETQAASLSEEE